MLQMSLKIWQKNHDIQDIVGCRWNTTFCVFRLIHTLNLVWKSWFKTLVIAFQLVTCLISSKLWSCFSFIKYMKEMLKVPETLLFILKNEYMQILQPCLMMPWDVLVRNSNIKETIGLAVNSLWPYIYPERECKQ